MSITYNQLQGEGPAGDTPAAKKPKSLAAENRRLAKELARLQKTIDAQNEKLKDLRQRVKSKPAPPPAPAALDPRLAAELQRLRIREQTLTDDAHNTTRILEAAQQELERQKKALAAARAGQTQPDADAQQRAAADLQAARADTDRVRNELALARAELAAEREARRHREDELVQNLRHATAHLDAAAQTVSRQRREHEAQRQALAAQEAAAQAREQALQAHLAALEQAASTTWFVRLDDGTLLGPAREAEIRDWAGQCRLGPDHELSRDRETWIRARDLPALQLEWMVSLADGSTYGPLNVNAIPHLIADGSVPADAAIRNVRTGFAATARDAGIPDVLTLRADRARLEKELAELRAVRPSALPASATPAGAPPKSVRAQILKRAGPGL